MRVRNVGILIFDGVRYLTSQGHSRCFLELGRSLESSPVALMKGRRSMSLRSPN